MEHISRASAEKLAERLGMSPQEEGGMVKENHYAYTGAGRAASGQSYYYFRPNVATRFHRLDCDEYWLYHAGSDIEAWVIDPEGGLTIRRLGLSDGAELSVYLPQGSAFAARPVRPCAEGTLISVVTVPRFSEGSLRMMEREEIVALCPAAKAFFETAQKG